MINYNMAETLEESLKSILDQLDDRFEVLVIDDGSTDGSQEILDKLEEEYNIFRWKKGNNENIGEARAQANREAEGEYVLTQLDCDDVYEPVILDFVKVFEKLNEHIDGKFYLSGNNLNMAPRSLLMDVNYRSLGYGEDKDLWRRLLAEDALVPLEMGSPNESIGYDYGSIDQLKIAYESTKVDFLSGISFWSFFRWQVQNLEYVDDYFKILTSPVAFLKSILSGRMSQPEGYEEYGKLFEELDRKRKTLRELEEEYGFSLEEELSDKGKEIFYT
jgi:glycosyltransferase involved in cell wall biosynthesis